MITKIINLLCAFRGQQSSYFKIVKMLDKNLSQQMSSYFNYYRVVSEF